MNNLETLKYLRTAPDSQLSPELLQETKDCAEDKPSIQALFTKIYNATEADRSRFVAAMVNPEFTSKYE